jgi:hypothetical protein
MVREELLARTFVELSETLVTDANLAGFLDLLVRRLVEVLDVPGAGGVVLCHPTKGPRVIGASDERMYEIQVYELPVDEGPCLDALRLCGAVQAITAHATEQWENFARRALESGYQAVAAFPLRLRERIIGSVNLFSTEPRLLGPLDMVAGQALADVATIALLQERALRDALRLAEQLQTALHSRVVIEQAKGMLAARAGGRVDDAFALLRRYARNSNRRIDDVARDVVIGRLAPTAICGHRGR